MGRAMGTPRAQTCKTCTDVGRRGNCAPLRCYCGHEDCHAFGSWKPLTRPNITDTNSGPVVVLGDAWADRKEGSSWIDKL